MVFCKTTIFFNQLYHDKKKCDYYHDDTMKVVVQESRIYIKGKYVKIDN